MQSEAKTFSASTYNSNEFIHAMPKQLGKQTLAIIRSLKATAETVKAVEGKRRRSNHHRHDRQRAPVVAKVGQYVVTYSNGDDQILQPEQPGNGPTDWL